MRAARNAVAAAIALLIVASGARAAEIDALISTAVKAATDEIVPPFEKASGHKLRAIYGPSAGSPGNSTMVKRPMSSSSTAQRSTR